MNLDGIIIAATSEIFETMIMLEVTPGDVVTDKSAVFPSNVTGTLGLAGTLKGALAVHCPEDVAKAITGSFLGMEVEEIDDDVKDAIGELVNMIAGGIKTSLAQDDKDLELAIPMAVTGKSYRIAGMFGAERIVVPFTLAAGQFWVELKFILEK